MGREKRGMLFLLSEAAANKGDALFNVFGIVDLAIVAEQRLAEVESQDDASA